MLLIKNKKSKLCLFPYHCAIDSQGAVVQLTDSVGDLDVYSIFAPLNSGQWVSTNLAV